LICSGFPSFSFQLVYSIHFLLCSRRSVRKLFLLFCCIRSLTEFPKILAIAVDSLLCSCDDQESDVRLVAGESLNKLIKVHESRREIGYELFWACNLHVLQVFENEIYYTYSLKINTPPQKNRMHRHDSNFFLGQFCLIWKDARWFNLCEAPKRGQGLLSYCKDWSLFGSYPLFSQRTF